MSLLAHPTRKFNFPRKSQITSAPPTHRHIYYYFLQFFICEAKSSRLYYHIGGVWRQVPPFISVCSSDLDDAGARKSMACALFCHDGYLDSRDQPWGKFTEIKLGRES